LRHGARSCVTVALRKEERLLGLITIYREEVRPFSDHQIALLQNFAAQAVIAIENARLITETREALEQQTATAEVLGVINSSPGDLTPVFEAMLEKAIRLCRGDAGVLWTLDGERASLVASYGNSPEIVELLRRQGEMGTHPLLRRVIAGEHLFQFDLGEHQVFRSRSVDAAGHAVRAGTRTVIWVALVKDGVAVGAFVIGRLEVRPFSNGEIALLQNFAAQAVIAIENARLITETREALEQQTATAEVLGVINSSPGDLAPVFDAMLEKAIRLCEATHGHFFNFDGECFHLGAVSDDASYVEWARQAGPIRPGADTPLGRMNRGERVVHTVDMREEEVYRTVPAFRAQVDLRGARSQITVGLLKDSSLLGALVLYRQEVRPFSEKQIALLQNFAAQAVIAMENARLLGELRQRTDEVAELNRGLEARVAEQVDELGRVGRLKQFLAPQLAELIVSHGDEKILESHRQEIVVVFCDLRGYTAFTETAEPEEVLAFLREYHGALGPLVSEFEGTLDQFSGDGIMVFFNDPVPCPDPAERAVKMAVAMREAASKLTAAWHRHGCDLGFGSGIAQGFATLGQIGFSDRSGYTAIGTVCNLAARLCAEAKDGQILVSSRIAEAVEAVAKLEDLGNLELKGLRRPVAAFNVTELISAASAPPDLPKLGTLGMGRRRSETASISPPTPTRVPRKRGKAAKAIHIQ
jgi:adenylate cyclase